MSHGGFPLPSNRVVDQDMGRHGSEETGRRDGSAVPELMTIGGLKGGECCLPFKC